MTSITFCILSGITEEWSNQSVNGHWRIHCKRSRNPAWTGLTSFKAYPSIAKNPGFLWFYLTLLCGWSRKLTLSSQASWCKTHTNHDLVACVFLRLSWFASFHFDFSLAVQGIFSFFWLVAVNTLVLVFQHSVEKHSKKSSHWNETLFYVPCLWRDRKHLCFIDG